MDLVIDVGNTLAKLAVFNPEGLMLKRFTVSLLGLTDKIKELKALYSDLKYCIVSSVGGIENIDFAFLKNNFQLLHLTSESPVAFINKYETPRTLGVDRMALVSAVHVEYIKQNVLVIDAGTCLTYDFINANGEYFGGAISPGLTMRYKAMHTFTEKLPLLEPDKDISIVGSSTAKAMHSGVHHGMAFEIDGYINAYRKQYPNLTVVFTGGDADFLRDIIKNHIFVNTNLLLNGLFTILNYNKDIS